MRFLNTKLRASGLSIGVLSAQAGVNIETIRYYERVGLMPPPPRSDGGHRVYDETHRQRLTFIRRARELGFPLDDIRHLLGLERPERLTCDQVKALTEQHVTNIARRISDLRRLQRALRALAAQCDGGSAPACPILDALGSAPGREG
jgi:MerR family transcriptional regulator, mercuric resistance operon regulatory protein